MLRDCPLCLLGNSQAMPSYRQSIQRAVGDLPLRGGRSQWMQPIQLLSLSDLLATSAQHHSLASWPMDPSAASPLHVAKSSGELAFVPCVPMLRDCPSAYSATRRLCHLIGGQSGGQLETCPRAEEAREGREVTVSIT